jgi:uncharacterized protein (TIGR02391 family)
MAEKSAAAYSALMSDKPLGKLIEELEAFQERYGAEIASIEAQSRRLMDACSEIERSWSGSFAGWHGRMYFRDFGKPSLYQRFSGEWGGIQGIPDGWEEKDAKEVAERISDIIGDGFSVEAFEKRIEALRTAIQDLKIEIDIHLSLLDTKALDKEQALIEELKSFSLGDPRAKYVLDRLPKSIVTRDREAITQGICNPAWLCYAGVGYEGQETIRSLNKYRKQIVGLVKQATARMKAPAASHMALGDLDWIHPEIRKKCAKLYMARAHAEAVEKSFKVVRDKLRHLTGYETGSDAFGKGKLHVRGAAAPHVDKDFNEAVKFLLMAIDRFRNEKSHTSDAKIRDPVRAHQYLVLSSLAMYLLEDAEIGP